MFKQKDILDERYSKLLRQKSEEVIFPFDEKDSSLLKYMIEYLRVSQDEEYAKKNKIRAGMGLAAIQLGIPKRFFAISYKMENGNYEEYEVINPKIISHSEELIYVEEGEGCLSVNREVDGYVKRYARIKVTGYDEFGKEITLRVKEELAIAFQHELDHLDGIIFTDKITNDIDGIRTI